MTGSLNNTIELAIPTERHPEQLSRYSDSLLAERTVDQIPIGGEIFLVAKVAPSPNQPSVRWEPVPSPGLKRSDSGIDHPPPYSLER